MKYVLSLKAGNNSGHEIAVSFVEDFNGDITDEVCVNFQGLEDFKTIETFLILNEKDLNNLIGMLLQVQQKLRFKK